MGDLGSSSFEFYDGVRVLVTGAILTAIYVALAETFALDAPLPSSDALTALSAVTLSGLFMYFLDLPGRSVLYSAMLPHKVLERWKLQAPGGRTMQNVYFVLLDSRMPPVMRTRAQYYGSMFRIAFDAIVLLCLSGTVAAAAAFLCTYPSGRVHGDGARPVMIVGSSLFLVLALCALAAAYVRVKPKDETRKQAVVGALKTQVPWPDRVMLILIAVGSTVFGFQGADWMLIVTGAVGSALWLFRYLRGALRPERRGCHAARVDDDGKPLPERWRTASRRNVDASTATLLLCAIALAIWIPASVRTTDGTHLSSAAAVGWTAAVLLGGILMLARGHELRFWGSYYTTATWLDMEREKIIAEYGLADPAPPPEPVQPWWRGWLGLD